MFSLFIYFSYVLCILGFIQYFSYGIFESTGYLSDEEIARRQAANAPNPTDDQRVEEESDEDQHNIHSTEENEPFLT